MSMLHPEPIPTETFSAVDDLSLQSSRRQDGWSAANQRLFLTAIAAGHGVDVACLRVGLSPASAYAFRRTAKGAAFALGWRAGTLLAREAIADTLLVRALEGQVETVVRSNGQSYTRHRHDNRLSMSLLARLDRQVEQCPDADIRAARLVAQEFDAFLDCVEKDDSPARAGLFLARRADALQDDQGVQDLAPLYALAAADRFVRTGVPTAGEVDTHDLDPHQRAGWSAEQWARAEAAGLFAFATPEEAVPEDTALQNTASQDTTSASQHSQRSDEEEFENYAAQQVWWDAVAGDWRTSFPPPEDFCGVDGYEGEYDYERELTAEERALVGPPPLDEDAADLAAFAEMRDRYFAILAARAAAAAPVVAESEAGAAAGAEPGDTPAGAGASAPAASCTAAGNTAPPIAPPAPLASGSV